MLRRTKILILIFIICIFGFCSCGIDAPASIDLVRLDEKGLYYNIHASNKSELYCFDESTGKSKMISGECGPLMDDAGNSTVLCRTENMVLYDENKKEIYLLQDDCLYFAAKLDLSVISGGAESIKSAPYIYKMTEDDIYWGFREMIPDSDTEMCLGIYKQNLQSQRASVILEQRYDQYFDIAGVVNDIIYIRTYDGQLLTVNAETGEENVVCESSLLSAENLMCVYEDGMVIFKDNAIYWSDLTDVQFDKIAVLDGYSPFLYGIDRRDDMIYFVVEYDENGSTRQGIASLDLETEHISLYQEFSGWKNRNVHVSDIRVGENGFYYINATHSKLSGGGLYYYNMQEDTFVRIAD